MNIAELRIRVDADWIALNVYRMALERIAKEAEAGTLTVWEIGQLARSILAEFPGGFRA